MFISFPEPDDEAHLVHEYPALKLDQLPGVGD